MKQYLKALLSENGSISMMRVMSLMSCITAVIIALIGLYKPQPDYSGLSMLCGTFLSIAFGGKVMQKRIEVSGAKSDSEITTKI